MSPLGSCSLQRSSGWFHSRRYREARKNTVVREFSEIVHIALLTAPALLTAESSSSGTARSVLRASHAGVAWYFRYSLVGSNDHEYHPIVADVASRQEASFQTMARSAGCSG